MSAPGAAIGLVLALTLAPAPARAEAVGRLETPAVGALQGGSDTLWQAPASSPCRLRLVRLDGPVRVVIGNSIPRLLGKSGPWRLAATTVPGEAGEELQLTVGWLAPPEPPVAILPPAATDPPTVVLEVPVACQLSVGTESGAIEVRGPRLASLDARSTTGDIVLWVDPADEPDVEFATSGEITVDFSVTIDYVSHQEPAKRGRIGVRPGGSWAKLFSLRGAVRVLRHPLEPSPSE